MRRLRSIAGMRRDRTFGGKSLAIRFDGELGAEPISIVFDQNLRPSLRGNRVEITRAWSHPALRRVVLMVAMIFAICSGLPVWADSCPLFITASAAGYSASYSFSDHFSFRYYPAGASGTYEYRNFFIFAIPTLTQTVVSAELWISDVSNLLTEDSETYELNEVTNSAHTVRQEGVYQPDVFADLGDGALYG